MTEVWREAARRLPPGAFAVVMATGIVSTAQSLLGWSAPSLILLLGAACALTVLAALTIARVALFPREVASDAGDPGRVFGFFTIVAALDVVAARLAAAGQPVPAAVLAVLSLPCWLVLIYAVPTGLFLRAREADVSRAIDGSWLLSVVATQAVAIAAATASATLVSTGLADLAVALWGIGAALYAVLTLLIVLRLLTVRSRAESFAATYWILLGATAISVLAGARILQLPAALPIMRATGAVVSGTSYLLWALGTWWIPLLVIFGVWRYLVERVPVRYESALWSMVFPLGMYATASMTFGEVTHLPFMVTTGRVATWVATLAWLAVLVLAARATLRRLRVERQGRELAPRSPAAPPPPTPRATSLAHAQKIEELSRHGDHPPLSTAVSSA